MDIDWEKLGIKIDITDRPLNHRGDQITITLPDKKYIMEEPTDNYLVLISNDGENVIMPQFLTYVINAIKSTRGICKPITKRCFTIIIS